MSDQTVKRQLGGMPTGTYDMADMQFSVREVKPPKIEEEPSTVSEYELWDGKSCIDARSFSVALPPVQSKPNYILVWEGKAAHWVDADLHSDPEPFRELEEAVNRWIKREGLDKQEPPVVLRAGESTVMNGMRVTNRGPVSVTLISVDVPEQRGFTRWTEGWDL